MGLEGAAISSSFPKTKQKKVSLSHTNVTNSVLCNFCQKTDKKMSLDINWVARDSLGELENKRRMSGEERWAVMKSVYQNKLFTLDGTLIIFIIIIIIICKGHSKQSGYPSARAEPCFHSDSSVLVKNSLSQAARGQQCLNVWVHVNQRRVKQVKVEQNFATRTNRHHQFQLTDRLLVSLLSQRFHPCPSMSVAITKQLHPVLGGRTDEIGHWSFHLPQVFIFAGFFRAIKYNFGLVSEKSTYPQYAGEKHECCE